MRKLNAPDAAPDIEFEVDREHSGVRMVGCTAFIIGAIGSYFLLSALIVNGGLLTLGAALALGVGLTYAADYAAKTWWPSNRYLQFAGDMIQLARGDRAQGQIDASRDVNFFMWHFEAKRHPRVPKGWYVVANALEQDGDYIVSYSILSPKDFEALPLARLSTRYQRKKKGKNDESGDLKEAGAQRRIVRAEFHRGELGAEMSPEDYHEYLDYLANTYTAWMPKSK